MQVQLDQPSPHLEDPSGHPRSAYRPTVPCPLGRRDQGPPHAASSLAGPLSRETRPPQMEASLPDVSGDILLYLQNLALHLQREAAHVKLPLSASQKAAVGPRQLASQCL